MDPHDLSTAFSVWAAVVAIAGGWIALELHTMRKRLDRFMYSFHGRLTAVETHLHLRDGFLPVRSIEDDEDKY